MQKKLKAIPAFNPHVNCKGHSDSLLDCTFEEEGQRELLEKILGNYIEE